jgi:hypothetical protein
LLHAHTTCAPVSALLCAVCPLCRCRVSAHFVEQPSKEASKPTTTILIKFDASVMQRQAAMDAAKRGM